MTAPGSWFLADADPVGAAMGWLASGRFADLLDSLRTGPGRQVGALNEPPFPRLQVAEANWDPRDFTGLSWMALRIDILGDPNGSTGKAVLSRVAIAALEHLKAMREEPHVGGCTFTEVTGASLAWSPLPPTFQPRYVISPTLWFKPVRP